MKTSFYLFLLLTASCLTASAQEDTAMHRKVYAEVNARLDEFGFNTVKIQQKGSSAKIAVKVWFEASLVRKVVLTETQGPDYTRTTEFYYNPEQVLTFVFMTDDDGQTKAESRMYFSKTGDRMVRWLGMDKKPVAADSQEFRDFSKELIRQSEEILSQVGD